MNPVLMGLASAADIVEGGSDAVSTGGLEVADIVGIVLRIAFWLIGILAVAMIIYGGVKYVMSQGDSSKTKEARQVITYAVIGLVVAILAYAIVGFVLDSFKKTDESSEQEESEEGSADDGSTDA